MFDRALCSRPYSFELQNLSVLGEWLEDLRFNASDLHNRMVSEVPMVVAVSLPVYCDSPPQRTGSWRIAAGSVSVMS